jgi:hypothetical protein
VAITYLSTIHTSPVGPTAGSDIGLRKPADIRHYLNPRLKLTELRPGWRWNSLASIL